MKRLLSVLMFAGVAVIPYSCIQSDNLYTNEPAKIIEKIAPYQEVEGSGRRTVSATQYDVRIMWLKDGAETFIKLDGRTYQRSKVGDILSSKRCQDKEAENTYDLYFLLGCLTVIVSGIVLLFKY